MKKIEFKNKKGQNIVGILTEPNPQKKELVIIIHGFSSNKDKGSKNSAQDLETINVNSLRIDLDDRGESEPHFEQEASITNYAQTTICAIQYARSIGYESVSLLGTSFGGPVVILAAQQETIKRICLLAPSLDFWRQKLATVGKEKLNEYKEQGFFTMHSRTSQKELHVNYNCIEESKQYNFYELIKNIPCPIKIIHGTKDSEVPYEISVDISKNLNNKSELVLLKDADHKLSINGDYSKRKEHLKKFFSS